MPNQVRGSRGTGEEDPAGSGGGGSSAYERNFAAGSCALGMRENFEVGDEVGFIDLTAVVSIGWLF